MGHVALIGKIIKSYSVLEKPEGKRSLGIRA
jgi:hypothetical protein